MAHDYGVPGPISYSSRAYVWVLLYAWRIYKGHSWSHADCLLPCRCHIKHVLLSNERQHVSFSQFNCHIQLGGDGGYASGPHIGAWNDRVPEQRDTIDSSRAHDA